MKIIQKQYTAIIQLNTTFKHIVNLLAALIHVAELVELVLE
jgi:hypothetical protein